MGKPEKRTPVGLRRLIRLAARAAALVAICALVSVASLEIVYRFAPIDPYRGELREYNPEGDLAIGDPRPTILFMGDSVTAGTGSYPDLVRRARPDLRVVNGGIPGSSVLQANLVVQRRVARFRPSVLVYQVNAGNDLLNLRYPVSWRQLSAVRNLYWTLAHRARSIEYLNYKAAQFVRVARFGKGHRPTLPDVLDEAACRFDFADFEPESYTARVRLYVRSEPGLFENQALVRSERRRDYENLLEGLREMLAHCERPACRAIVLVVPHAAQVHGDYQQALSLLGARFDEPERLLATETPFVAGIRDAVARDGLPPVEVVDAQPALREVERTGRRTYFLHDPHLNACGQYALATLMLSTLDGIRP